MNKDKLEKFVRNLGMEPVKRETAKAGEIFIADGAPPESVKASLIKRGALTIGEFPAGFFMTTWWIASGEDDVLYGPTLFFDKNHDPELLPSMKQVARINTALKEARAFTKQLERQRGRTTHH